MEDPEFAGHLAFKTDLPSDPPYGVEWSPYISGFVFETFYVLMKTFPDSSAGRGSMVFSHALLIDKKDAGEIGELKAVLDLFKDSIHKSPELSPITINIPTPGKRRYRTGIPALNKVVHGLLENHRDKKTIIWIGQENFPGIIRSLWNNLWPSARLSLNFRISFNPYDIDNRGLTIVCTPKILERKWQGYFTVNASDEYNPAGLSEFYLLGDEKKSKPLSRLVKKFEEYPKEITDLKKLERCKGIVEEPVTVRGYLEAITAIGRIAPGQEEEKKLKKEILEEFAGKLRQDGAAQDISELRNFNTNPFLNAEKVLSEHMNGWMRRNLFSPDRSGSETVSDLSRLMEFADSSVSMDWWRKTIKHFLRKTLNKWESHYSKILWNWSKEENKIFNSLKNYIPPDKEVEKELVENAPHEMGECLLEEIEKFSQKPRNWFILHAFVVSRLYEPEVAIKKQLAIDTDENYFAGLRELVKRIQGDIVLEFALESNGDRMVQLAKEVCLENPGLLDRIKNKDDTWLDIWLVCVEKKSNDPWEGVSDRRQVLFLILDRILGNGDTEGKLIKILESSDYFDLYHYPRRKHVWKNPELSQLFLQKTAGVYFDKYLKEEVTYDELEREIKEEIANSHRLKDAISDEHPLSQKIKLFEDIDILCESDFINFLESTNEPLQDDEAIQVGELIRIKKWKECTHLLGPPKALETESLPDSNASTEDDRPGEKERFPIIFYFPHDAKEITADVINALAEEFPKSGIPHDRHPEIEPEGSGLPEIAQSDSKLIIVFLLSDHKVSFWNGLYWEDIPDLIEKRDGSAIMLESGHKIGLEWGEFFPDIEGRENSVVLLIRDKIEIDDELSTFKQFDISSDKPTAIAHKIIKHYKEKYRLADTNAYKVRISRNITKKKQREP